MDKNLEIITSVVIIFVLLFLNIYIIQTSYGKDCTKCVISFKDLRTSGYGKQINVTFIELYTELKVRGNCIIIWDEVNGYMKNG